MADKAFIVILLYGCVTVVISGETCFSYNRDLRYNDSIYCSTTCCGDDFDPYCCKSVREILFIIFGVLAAILVVVIRVVCCCCRYLKSANQQECSRGQTSNQAQVSSSNANPIPNSSNINPSHSTLIDDTMWTFSGGTVAPSTYATSTNHSNDQNFTNNTNTRPDTQRATVQTDTCIFSNPPPPYDSLPPSYESLYHNNRS